MSEVRGRKNFYFNFLNSSVRVCAAAAAVMAAAHPKIMDENFILSRIRMHLYDARVRRYFLLFVHGYLNTA